MTLSGNFLHVLTSHFSWHTLISSYLNVFIKHGLRTLMYFKYGLQLQINDYLDKSVACNMVFQQHISNRLFYKLSDKIRKFQAISP